MSEIEELVASAHAALLLIDSWWISSSPSGSRRARDADKPRCEHEPANQRESHDHDRATYELGQCELPAHEHEQHDAELHDEVRRREHEDHRGREVGALLEQATSPWPSPRRSNSTTPSRSPTRPRPPPPDGRPSPRASAASRRTLARFPTCEAEHERPQRLPEHEERFAQASDPRQNSRQHFTTVRPRIAADASAILLRVAPPAATASATQCARC